MTDLNRKVNELKVRIQQAISVALQYGWIDGGHHKMWVIDQILRALMTEQEYLGMREEVEEDGDEYDEGIAP